MSFDDLASARARTLSLVTTLSQRQADFSPRPGAWSIGEVLDHLLRSEGLYRSEIRALIALKRAGRPPRIHRSFAEVNVGPAFLPRPLLPLLDAPFTMLSALLPDLLVDTLTRVPLLPVRNPDVATPEAKRSIAELRGELAASIADTGRLLEANRDIEFNDLVSEHPLTGSSSVPRLLRFLSMHERRHQGQIANVKAHPSFPRAFG